MFVRYRLTLRDIATPLYVVVVSILSPRYIVGTCVVWMIDGVYTWRM